MYAYLLHGAVGLCLVTLYKCFNDDSDGDDDDDENSFI